MYNKPLLFFVLVISTLIPSKVFAQSDSIFIDDFKSNVTVEQNGTVNITEQIVYVFNEPRHGITRKIPFSYKLENGSIQYLDIQFSEISYKAINSEKAYNNYTTSKDQHYITVKIGAPEKLVQGKYTYTISYSIKYLIENYSNLDKLYLNVIGDTWEDPIHNASATITMPVAIQESNCYTGPRNSMENNCTIKKSGDNQITVTGSQTFNNGNFLTVVTTVPAGSIYNLSQEKYNFNITYARQIEAEYNNKSIPESLSKIMSLVSAIIIGIIFIVTIAIILNLIKHPLKFDTIGISKYLPNTIPQYNIPRGWYIFKIPVFLGQNIVGATITAQIIQLCIYGYLKLIKDEEGIIIEKTNKPADTLDAPLKDFYNGLMQDKQVITIIKNIDSELATNSNFYTYTSVLKNSINISAAKITDNLKKEGLFVEKSFAKRKSFSGFFSILLFAIFTIVGLFLLLTGNLSRIAFIIFPIAFIIIFGIMMIKAIRAIGNSRVKYSETGEERLREIHGLHMYIKTTEQHRMEFNNDPEKYRGVFESLLPYAILFGLEKKWTQLFKNFSFSWYVNKTDSDWDICLVSSSISSFTLKGLSSPLLDSSSNRSSSGSSHGSSGGGGGGGGGGSW